MQAGAGAISLILIGENEQQNKQKGEEQKVNDLVFDIPLYLMKRGENFKELDVKFFTQAYIDDKADRYYVLIDPKIEKVKEAIQYVENQESSFRTIYFTGHGFTDSGNWSFKDGAITKQDIEPLFEKGTKFNEVIANCCYAHKWDLDYKNGCSFTCFTSRAKEIVISIDASQSTQSSNTKYYLGKDNSLKLRKLKKKDPNLIAMNPLKIIEGIKTTELIRKEYYSLWSPKVQAQDTTEIIIAAIILYKGLFRDQEIQILCPKIKPGTIQLFVHSDSEEAVEDSEKALNLLFDALGIDKQVSEVDSVTFSQKSTKIPSDWIYQKVEKFDKEEFRMMFPSLSKEDLKKLNME